MVSQARNALSVEGDKYGLSPPNDDRARRSFIDCRGNMDILSFRQLGGQTECGEELHLSLFVLHCFVRLWRHASRQIGGEPLSVANVVTGNSQPKSEPLSAIAAPNTWSLSDASLPGSKSPP